jgi:major membrane immunogen (membrane-anchored lipoprotein)
MKRILIAGLAGSLVLLAGCGEKEPVIVYKQGQYQGKPDKQPWDNAQFKGDKVAWEKAIKARNGNQNEYTRASN